MMRYLAAAHVSDVLQVGTLLLLLLLLLSIHEAQPTNEENDNKIQDDEDDEDPCTLYLAPSTIPNAGLGIFTAKEVQEGEIIGQPDVGIPIIDHAFHNGARRDPSIDYHVNFEDMTSWHVDVFDDYVWSGEATGLQHEGDDKDTKLFAPGLDAAINCNLALINSDHNTPQVLFTTLDEGEDDDPSSSSSWPHRYTSPGAGAMSAYFNGTTTSQTYIPAGAEVFKDYGSAWFDTRMHLFELTPLVDDYQKAEQIVHSFVSRTREDYDKTTQQQKLFPKTIVEPLYDLIYNFGYKSRLVNAMPKYEEIDLVLKEGIAAVHQPSAIRSNLREMKEARCISHLERRPSLLPHAGNGAFARVNFNKGDLITGSPLLHIAHHNIFKMYDEYTDKENFRCRNESSFRTYQLLINYCWSHPQTTLLLCPYGSGINYLNHNRPLANVELRWSPHGQIGMDEGWLSMSPRQIGEHDSWGQRLSFDYVATRDISEGEELYIDYGQEWEDAWNEHVRNWKPQGPADYEPAAAFNHRVHNGKEVFRTKDELPYADHLTVRCHPSIRYKRILQSRNEEMLSTTGDMTWTINPGRPCEIVKRRTDEATGSTMYTVNLTTSNETTTRTMTGVVDMVPANLIALRDKTYTTDMHLPNAFRHYAVIPDHLLPDVWRNNVDRVGQERKNWSVVGGVKHDEL